MCENAAIRRAHGRGRLNTVERGGGDGHRYPTRGVGARTERTMSIEDTLSPNAIKVYRAMKDLNYSSEEKMGTAERITQTSKLPKNMALNALQELQTKGLVRRKVREKSAGYYLVLT